MTAFPSFEEFFWEISKFEPHLWQSNAIKQVTDQGRWPWNVSVPTGLGKTSVLAMAVYELARQLHGDKPRTAPQRIFHVVDRRAVIDSTFDYMTKMAEKVNNAKSGPLFQVGSALRKLTGPDDNIAILVGSIHGERSDDYAWMRSTGCTLVSLTSHQFVSRLLFRGFGVSSGVRPISAGLCAIDRLVFFDEPHLSAQAIHTILSVEKMQSLALKQLNLPQSQTVLLGATIPPELEDLGNGSFCLSMQDVNSHVELKRLHAKRDTTMAWVKSNSDRATETALVKSTAEAWASGAERVVVFVNTVAMAQSVFRELERESVMNSDSPAAKHISLLTSRFRPFDKDFHADGPGTVVATQTLEVGVDLSFDWLVSEVSAWSSIVQRLGRLNRDGESDFGCATLVAGWSEDKGEAKPRKDSMFIYGDAPIKNVTILLRELESENGGGPINLSPAAVQEIDSTSCELELPPQRVGTLTSAMLPLVGQTNPTPSPDFPISALISGPDVEPSDEVQVSWRGNLSVFDDNSSTIRVSPDEKVSIPRKALIAFLSGDKKQAPPLQDGAASVNTADEPRYFDIPLQSVRIWDRQAQLWAIPTTSEELRSTSQMVLQESIGGYSNKQGWTGEVSKDTQLDIAFSAALKQLIAMHKGQDSATENLESQDLFSQKQVGSIDLTIGAKNLGEFPPEWKLDTGELAYCFEQVRYKSDIEDEDLSELSIAASDFAVNLASILPFECRLLTTTSTAFVLRMKPLKRGVDSQRPVLLDTHEDQVSAWAFGDAVAAGLDSDLAFEFAIAGILHDEGKRDEAFQTYILGRKGGESDLAKSGKQFRRGPRRSSERDGWDHYVESVRRNPNASLIVSHLVGSHHGWMRPFIKPSTWLAPQSEVPYPGVADHVDDFVRLNDEYGLWGLAYLEAVLRLADWRASRNPLSSAAITAADRRSETTILAAVTARKASKPFTKLVDKTTTAAPSFEMGGLVSTPQAAWFASVGLLAAASSFDPDARLWWASSVPGGAPVIPVLQTTKTPSDLVRHIYGHASWLEAEEMGKLFFGKKGFGTKYQKMNPASRVRPLLLEAENKHNEIALMLAHDLGKADNNAAQVEMQLVANANISSYPGAAFDTVLTKNADFLLHIEGAVNAITSPNSGYRKERRDGGFDRNPDMDPTVDGLGNPVCPVTRADLTPLVLFGIAALGAGPLGGVTVNRGRDMRLPLPSKPSSFAQVRALTYLGLGPDTWKWEGTGFEWLYVATKAPKTQYIRMWVGNPQTRADIVGQKQIKRKSSQPGRKSQAPKPPKANSNHP